MVNVSNVLVFTLILIGGAAVFIGVGGLELAGSQTTNMLCELPLVSGLDYCSASAQPQDKYLVTHGVKVNRNSIVDNSFRYKTVKAGNSYPLSLTGDALSLLTRGKNVKIEYFVRQDGKLLASGSKRLGTIDTFKTESPLFENKLASGTYQVQYLVYGDQCNFLGCSDFTDKLSTTMEVPKFPLGDY